MWTGRGGEYSDKIDVTLSLSVYYKAAMKSLATSTANNQSSAERVSCLIRLAEKKSIRFERQNIAFLRSPDAPAEGFPVPDQTSHHFRVHADCTRTMPCVNAVRGQVGHGFNIHTFMHCKRTKSQHEKVKGTRGLVTCNQSHLRHFLSPL
ncbi:hypothetical protein BDR22DRAFT_859288, partial [Usnea florida]